MATKDKNGLRLAPKPPQERAPRAGRREQPDRRSAGPKPRLVEDELTIEQARQKWPDMVPWPLPGPVHGRAGFETWTGWKGQQYLGGETKPEDIIGYGMNAFLVLVGQVKLLQHGEVVQQTEIANHTDYGKFYLRAVLDPVSGYLFGVIDENGLVYGACEWYSEDKAKEAWKEWIRVLNQ